MLKFLFIGLLITCSIYSNAGDWKLEKNSEGIKVYTRSNEGSEVLEFKATATINASRMSLAKIIANVAGYPNWFPNCSSAQLVEVISSTQRKYYYKLDLPWPASDRDAVMLLSVDVNNGAGITILNFTKSTGKPEVSGVIRMPAADGFWKLKTISESKTELEYQFLADPGGSLPTWIINMFIVDGPFDTLIALKAKLK
jgi:hypothetical protein